MGSNLVWMVTLGIYLGPPKRFLNFRLGAEIWGIARKIQGVSKMSKNTPNTASRSKFKKRFGNPK